MEEITTYGTNTQISRTPELIAAEINSIKNQTRNMMMYNSIEIGRRLFEAKEMLQHGEWGSWLKEKVDYSQRTATNLMRIFDEYGATQITLLEANSNSQALANLSYTQAVALLGIPEEDREAFVEEHDIDSMSTRELQQAIKDREAAQKEKEEALKKLENFKRIAFEKTDEAKKFFDEKLKAESEVRLTDRLLRETQADVKMLQETLEKEREDYKNEAAKLEAAIDKAKKQLSEAQASGDDEEAIRLKESLEEKEKELKESLSKIEKLEQELKDKPDEIATAVIEKVPEEIEKELAELRKKVQSSTMAVKFNVHFDTLVKDFKNLLGSLAEIEGKDPEASAKYKNAVYTLISKMIERVS